MQKYIQLSEKTWDAENKVKHKYKYCSLKRKVSNFHSVSCYRNENYSSLVHRIYINQEGLEINKNKDVIIFLLSELDCEVCAQSLYDWVNSIHKSEDSLNIMGIYFKKDSSLYAKNDKYVENTRQYIKWKMINDADIFKYCEDITGEYG